MEENEMNTLIEEMRNAIGEDNSAKISEQLVKIVNANNSQNSKIATLETEKTKLENDKTELLKTNGSLLQQITVPKKDIENKNQEKEDNEKLSIDDIFDEKGNFKD